MLPQSISHICMSPNDLFCKKPKIKLSCLCFHQLTVSFWLSKQLVTWAPLESPGSDVPQKSIGEKGHWLAAELHGVKIELVFQPLISYRFKYQVLYASFERQIKCISNPEPALSVTVYRITVKNKSRQTKNIWWVNYFIRLMNRCVSWWSAEGHFRSQ